MGNVALQLFNDHPPSWILLSIRKQWLFLDLLSLFLLVIMHLFAKMDSKLVYNASCGCMPLSFLL